MPRPSPRLPPVTMTLRIRPGELAGGGNVERGHEMDDRRYFVPRQGLATGIENLVFQSLGLGYAGRGLDHDIGDDDGPGDRALARLDQRHADRGMAVDHRLDLFGVDLEAADIDDPAAAADEMVAAVAQLDHVAGIDEAVGAAERLGHAAEIAVGGA